MTKLSTHIPIEYIKKCEKLQDVIWKPEKRDEDIFELLYFGYEINIKRDEDVHGEKLDNGFYIEVVGEDGCYLYDGYYTKSEDMDDAIFEAFTGADIYEEISPTIADIIDNAEELFGNEVVEFMDWDKVERFKNISVRILMMCLTGNSIEEISEYIIKNIK